MALRCFIAVSLLSDIRRSVGDLIEDLRMTGADVKWVAYDNIHITMKFLGSTDEALISDMKESLNKKLSSYSPFYIKISGIGYFPPGRHPRVLWVGIQDASRLKNLHKDIDADMAKFGYPKEERDFSAHLTIGRVRSSRKIPDVLKRIEEVHTAVIGEMEVKGIAFMKSDLKPAGAEYSCLAEIPFGGIKDDK